MRVFFDEGVPEPLANDLYGHEVRTVRQLGLNGMKNSSLLALAESLGVEVFITGDKAMKTQKSSDHWSFATLILSTTFWPDLQKHRGDIIEALDRVKPGEVRSVCCGNFVPSRSKRLSEPSA